MLAMIVGVVATAVAGSFFGWGVYEAWRRGLAFAESGYQEWLARQWGTEGAITMLRREELLADLFRRSYSSRVYNSQSKEQSN